MTSLLPEASCHCPAKNPLLFVAEFIVRPIRSLSRRNEPAEKDQTAELGRMIPQPIANRGACGTLWFRLQNLQILLARFGGLAELLRV